jgi:hypothetical protein
LSNTQPIAQEIDMTDSNFYLGGVYDPAKQTLTDRQVTYDPADLTTHAVVTGMTGSGKTGLCVAMLEEAALKGIPAIIIDPKGDLTNLLLHFPNLAPQDFQPWVDADQARRTGKTVEQVAFETSSLWRNGLNEWGITPERIVALKNSAQFAIFTPGSNSGIPVSVLSSLAAPEIPWEDNREVLRERIASTVTAMLGLVGYDDIDPLRSREHMLLANIFEDAWRQKKNVDFKELILKIQTPPFDKIGAFEVNKLFPDKDRMDLAMALNNVLVSSVFEPWLEGRPLDIQAMLYASDDRPQHSIFYLAHLPDNQKMFFVTLLLSAIDAWMRTQSGTSVLRALIYMDEIYGYMPPISNPPSKGPLLRMLKQARGFGIGLVLGTQNPADIDYKGLSNAGTWFVGKLQTEQDKNRLLDGLVSVSGGISRKTIDELLSSLGKRVFILHSVHANQPVVFQTRWTMNYLAGPQMRNRISELNQLANFDVRPASVVPRAAVAVSRGSIKSDISETKSFVPAGVREYFLPQNFSLPEAFKAAGQSMPAQAQIEGVVYRPALMASAQVRILDRKLGVDSEITRAAFVPSPEKRGSVRWDEYVFNGHTLENAETSPAPSSRFGSIDAPLNDSKLMTALQKDFTDWVYRNSSVQARANEALKVYAGPDVSRAEFMKACSDAASEKRDTEIEKATARLDRQLKTLEDRLAREERELAEDQVEHEHRKWEERGNLAELGAGLLGIGRKKSLSTQLSKRRLTEKAKAEVEESIDAIAEFKKQIADLEKQREQMVTELNDKWGRMVNEISEVTVSPRKTDVFVNLFGVGWMPYYIVNTGTENLEIPAFGEE